METKDKGPEGAPASLTLLQLLQQSEAAQERLVMRPGRAGVLGGIPMILPI